LTIAIGPFDLIEPVARGGMAEVWRGEHRAQRVPVAVKVVTPPQGREQAYREQFIHEVQAMARLHHPAVVRIHDYGEIDTATSALTKGALPDGAPYLAMEWLAGGSLRALETMNWPRLRATLLTLLDALAHAHAHGVVHRDLKPDNVLIGDRGPVLTDFGLAMNPAVFDEKMGADSLGTPGYMAPEQAAGEDVDGRADVFSLGAVIYRAITGRPPFAGPDPLAIALASTRDQPVQPTALRDIPLAMELVLGVALAKEASHRFGAASEFAEAFVRALDDDIDADLRDRASRYLRQRPWRHDVALQGRDDDGVTLPFGNP